MDDIIDKILEISKIQESKTLQEMALKCAEETGEMCQAVLSYTDAPACGYKELGIDSVLEEIADVIIVATAMVSKLNLTKDDLNRIIELKVEKWLQKINS